MTYSNSVLLVGNGPSVLNHELGDLIDSFGTVCRCNNYVIKKYEQYVGTKTDVFFRRPCNNVTDHGVKYEKIVLCVTHRINTAKALQRSALSMKNRLKKDHKIEIYSGSPVEQLSKDMKLDFKTESASVGIIAIDYLLKQMSVAPLYIYGFDHLKPNGDKGLHYFPRKASGEALHNGRKEAEYTNRLAAQGLVIRLEDVIN